MRITKALAETIVASALIDRKNELENKRAEFAEWCAQAAEKAVPDEVVQCAKAHGSYLCSTTSAAFYLQGTRPSEATHFRLDRRVICPASSQYSTNYIELGKSAHREFSQLHKGIHCLKTDLEKAETELTEALLALGTKKRVIEQLPELEKYFPVETTSKALVRDYSKLRDLLK